MKRERREEKAKRRAERIARRDDPTSANDSPWYADDDAPLDSFESHESDHDTPETRTDRERAREGKSKKDSVLEPSDAEKNEHA
ncbi:MAG TPA: hypothetical protein VK116_04615 [Planctomycetota bacterium]|nr:hypothetical protein [Planctomycetota bacterium]